MLTADHVFPSIHAACDIQIDKSARGLGYD